MVLLIAIFEVIRQPEDGRHDLLSRPAVAALLVPEPAKVPLADQPADGTGSDDSTVANASTTAAS